MPNLMDLLPTELHIKIAEYVIFIDNEHAERQLGDPSLIRAFLLQSAYWTDIVNKLLDEELARRVSKYGAFAEFFFGNQVARLRAGLEHEQRKQPDSITRQDLPGYTIVSLRHASWRTVGDRLHRYRIPTGRLEWQ